MYTCCCEEHETIKNQWKLRQTSYDLGMVGLWGFSGAGWLLSVVDTATALFRRRAAFFGDPWLVCGLANQARALFDPFTAGLEVIYSPARVKNLVGKNLPGKSKAGRTLCWNRPGSDQPLVVGKG